MSQRLTRACGSRNTNISFYLVFASFVLLYCTYVGLQYCGVTSAVWPIQCSLRRPARLEPSLVLCQHYWGQVSFNNSLYLTIEGRFGLHTSTNPLRSLLLCTPDRSCVCCCALGAALPRNVNFRGVVLTCAIAKQSLRESRRVPITKNSLGVIRVCHYTG